MKHGLKMFWAAILVMASCVVAFCGEIHDAAKAGDVQRVTALLDGHPVLVKSKGNSKRSPLHEAKTKEVAALLLTRGAEVNALAEFDETPLHTSAREGRTEVVELLLAHGADVNARSPSSTPLHYAANAKIAELLLAKKADVKAKAAFGFTPLHVAARWARIDVVEVLLAHDADINAKDNQGRTPLKGVFEAREILLADEGPENARFREEHLRKLDATIRFLRAHGAKTLPHQNFYP